MSITNGYATLLDVKAWIPGTATADDAQLEEAVTSASRWIDQYCQRTFWQDGTAGSEKARRFDPPNDRRCLDLGSYNDLASITALKTDEDGDGTFEVTWSASDYELLPLNPTGAPETRPYTAVRATGTSRWFPSPAWTGRAARIEITGVWGWPAVPAAVHEACLIQAARIFKRRHSPEGVTGWQSEFGAVRLSTKADPDVVRLLDPYRLVPVLVA